MTHKPNGPIFRMKGSLLSKSEPQAEFDSCNSGACAGGKAVKPAFLILYYSYHKHVELQTGLD